MATLNMREHIKQESDGSVVILGPMKGSMRSYHASGLSPKEEYLEARRRAKAAHSALKDLRSAHIECVKREFRV